MRQSPKLFLILHFAFLIVLSLLPYTHADYADGNGSPEFPFQIAEPNQLIYMSRHPEHWGFNFIITADINMNLAEPNTFTTALIAPDTDNVTSFFQGTPFTGVFDGNGHIISNLTIDTDGTGNDYLGLFGWIESLSAKVKNLGLENINITGGIDSLRLGGLCGNNEFGSINNCYIVGSVSGGDYAKYLGGFCGRNNGNITNCYLTCLVTGGTNSYSLGGLCGYNNGGISNCYSTGSVISGDNSQYLGGLCGYGTYSNITNCYFLATAGPNNGLGTPLSDTQMKIQESYVDWDFVDEMANGTSSWWTIHPGEYPSLYFFDPTFVPNEFDGQGTELDPYLIFDPNDLGAIWQQPDRHYRLQNDIDLTGINWSVAVISDFDGVLDGNRYTISNLTISGGSHLGLIGLLSNDSKITSLDLVSVNITGGDYSDSLGGLCGCNSGGSISHCNSTGSVSGDGVLGGLCGYNSGGSISHCNSNSSVSGDGSLGGLCGRNSGGSISNCHSTGLVTGGTYSYYLGGLCGLNEDGSITNCYSTDLVIGGTNSYELGGLCGRNTGGSITNCDSTGSVSGGFDSHELGGLCGHNDYGSITDCYSNSSVTGEYLLGGFCGNNSHGTITNCYAYGSVSGVDYLGGLCGWNEGGRITNCYADVSIFGSTISDDLGGLCGRNSGGSISNCYSTGLVTSGTYSHYLGGLCGRNSEGSITNCYSTGYVTSGTNSYQLGGLCGGSYDGNISNCYFLDTSGPDNGCGIPLDDPNMRKQSSFVGWDFADKTSDGTSSTWIIHTGEYPTLFCFDPAFVLHEFEGQGTAQDPYLIFDPNDLGAIYQQPDCYYQLQNDIDLTGITWSIAVIPEFLGTLDGYNHIISPLNISGGSYVGLIGILSNGAKITNLGLANINITAGNDSRFLGGLCGLNEEGSITNCHAEGSITGGYDSHYLGGLCGWNGGGSITNCYTDSSIGGYDSHDLGGLCGRNAEGSIINCYSTGSVTSSQYAYNLGGLCGNNDNGSITHCYSNSSITGGNDSYGLGSLCGRNFEGNIINCCANGSVTGNRYLGGLCGVNYGSITNCYSNGSVTGGEYSNYLGGLCGRNSGGSITNCYSIGPVIAGVGATNFGGLCGENLDSITACYFLDTAGPDNGYGEPLADPNMRIQASFVGWDFVGEEDNGTEDHWQLCLDGYDYPRLTWQFINPADFLSPGRVDNYDLMVLTHDWLTTDSRCCDIAPSPDGDDIVNLLDFHEFSKYWLTE